MAYSLVCPDEVPFVYDLHLFLGRPLQLATPQLPTGKGLAITTAATRGPHQRSIEMALLLSLPAIVRH